MLCSRSAFIIFEFHITTILQLPQASQGTLQSERRLIKMVRQNDLYYHDELMIDNSDTSSDDYGPWGPLNFEYYLWEDESEEGLLVEIDLDKLSVLMVHSDNDDNILEFIQEKQLQMTREGQIEMVMEMCIYNGYDSREIKRTTLQSALLRHMSDEIVLKLIEIGGRELVMKMDSSNQNALSYACRSMRKSFQVISKLIELGGKELVMKKDNMDKTVLHYAFDRAIDSSEKNIISALLEVGGRELLLADSDNCHGNAFHYGCLFGKSIPLEIILMFIDIGGKDFVMSKELIFGKTVLHQVCGWNEDFLLEIISKFIEIGGKDLVMIKDNDGTALHKACENRNVSLEIISKLVSVGGRELVMANSRFPGTALHAACSNENISLEIISMLVEIGGHELVMKKSERGTSVLNAACQNENISLSLEIISKLVKIGGMDLVMMVSDCEGSALNSACRNKNVSLEMISNLIKMGGRELVMKNDCVLHSACSNETITLDVISKLIDIGGRELVMMVDSEDEQSNALLCACMSKNISYDIVSKLIEIGGRELVMMTDGVGTTSLLAACENQNVSLEVISMLVEVGGQELVVKNFQDGTVLHCACRSDHISIEMMSKLIEAGGHELLIQKDEHNNIALYDGWFLFYNELDHVTVMESFHEKFKFMLEQGILANVGGEFGVGGLFNYAESHIQENIYEKWEQLLPFLESVLLDSSLDQNQQPPILHAAILAEAPSKVICDIIDSFEFSILKVNSMKKYPIEIALDIDLPWDEGLRVVVEATAIQTQHQRLPTSILYSAAQYGLKWRYHMKELAEAYTDEIVNGCDGLTGLHLFMVAAMGECYDLSAIYGMMKMSPLL